MIDTTKNIQLFHGDCLEVMNQIPDKSIDLILTDIPYNEVNRKSNGLRILDKNKADILTFDLQSFLVELNRVCRGSIYVFCGTEQVSTIRKNFVELKLSTRHCVWEKTNPSPMNGKFIWLSSIENCIFAKKKNAIFNEHCKSAVWRYSCGRNKQHPTEKNLDLFKYLVSVSSINESIVLDPCMGSGTTGVACKQLGRKFIGIEKEEDYMKIAVERIKNAKEVEDKNGR